MELDQLAKGEGGRLDFHYGETDAKKSQIKTSEFQKLGRQILSEFGENFLH